MLSPNRPQKRELLDMDGLPIPPRPAHIGTVVTTIHGNKLRRFKDGWSPLKGAHWDRWTVYTDAELAANFTLAEH